MAPFRIEIERRLKEQVAQARRNGGVDMYFPVEITESGPVPASFVVSEVRLGLPGMAGEADLHHMKMNADGAASLETFLVNGRLLHLR